MSVDEFGQYEILAEIGRGGMGIVYKAIDRKDNRTVAIKKLVLENIDKTKEKEFRDRFRREAATAHRLEHPNIVTVFDVSTYGDDLFYVMEYLEGKSLKRELEERKTYTPEEFLPLLRQLCDGLSFAHSMNVVHRDVKPDNVFILSDGTVKVTDFGIARAADFEETQLTKTGVMLGTLAYVSPEQLQDAKNVDHRADIFSLGVVSYEALSGIVPFTADGIAATIVKIVSHQEKPLHQLKPELSVEVSAAVAKTLRKRARDRYRSVLDYVREFERAVGCESSQETKTGEIPALPNTPTRSCAFTTTKPAGHAGLGVRGEEADPTQNNLSQAPNPNELTKELDTTMVSEQNQVTMTDLAVDPHVKAEIFKAESQSPEEKNEERMKPGRSFGLGRALPAQPQSFQSGATSVNGHNQAGPKHQSSGGFCPIKLLYMIEDLGKNNAKLHEPAALCSRSGKLVVADTDTRRMHIFSFDGRWVGDLRTASELTGSRTQGGTVTRPSGIAIDPRGRVFVCDSSDQFIRMFETTGAFQREFRNIQGTQDGGLQGLAIDSTGLLYASDPTNGCLQVFQPELGAWIRKIGLKGDKDGELMLPAGVAVDRLNQVYCVDYGTSRVSIFNKSGVYVRGFGSKGGGSGQFNVPRSVAVDASDKIYVLDSLNHRIQVFGPTGDWLYNFGGKGTEGGKFIGPSDLSIDQENKLLFVADKGNRRVQVLEFE